MADRVSQGYRLIDVIMKRVGPLADWTRQFKPEQQHLTLSRNDYDILRRWPVAAHAHGVDTVGGRELWFHGLELTYDGGPRRYQKATQPMQVDLAEQFPGGTPAPS
jgi:hypothetical protein